MLQVAAYIEAHAGTGQDRIQWLEGEDMIAVALADGAGGMGGGALAAETAVKLAIERLHGAPKMLEGAAWVRLLSTLDRQTSETRHAGECTLVALQADGTRVAGASVGDSEAWLIKDGQVTELTKKQNRKPLTGSNESMPVAFSADMDQGLLLVASDGLFRYTAPGKIVEITGKVPMAELPRALVNLGRLRSGKLQDDAAVFVAS